MKLSLLFILLISCSKAPISNRGQLKLIPESTLRLESERAYKDIIRKSRIDNYSTQARALKRVGKKIKLAVGSLFKSKESKKFLEDYQWEFNLIKDSQINAWAMPGGKVAFYSGIMPICGTDAGLAVVMGHEIAHALVGHGNERASAMLVQQFGLAALDELYLKKKAGKNRELILAGLIGGLTVGAQLPFSRYQESEADKIGLILMAEAGYDPREAIHFWQRMGTASLNKTPEFLSTHPGHDTRIENIKKALPEALQHYKSY